MTFEISLLIDCCGNNLVRYRDNSPLIKEYMSFYTHGAKFAWGTCGVSTLRRIAMVYYTMYMLADRMLSLSLANRVSNAVMFLMACVFRFSLCDGVKGLSEVLDIFISSVGSL